MKTPRISPSLVSLLLVASLPVLIQCGTSRSLGGWNPNAVSEAEETLALFVEEDSGLRSFVNESRGYAVFPTIGKGAVGVGGAHGAGTVFEGGEAVGSTTMTQLTIGFQFGGQAYSEVIFFEDEKTLDRFKSGSFEIAAQLSAVAVTAGASADAAFNGGVAVFTMAKGGLMYEASIGGQAFTFDPKE